MSIRTCRICRAPLSVSFCDLGKSPLSNAFLTPEDLAQGREPFYDLHAFVCTECKLVQLEAMEAPENIFSDYFYFSSYSSSWVEHARRYAEAAIRRFDLRPRESLVMEIASNDGYLLQHFMQRNIPVLGVEPAANVAAVARDKGIRTEVCFFGEGTARSLTAEYGLADVVAGNNVIAHVPDLHDFIAGVKNALKPQGTATFEFPHLMRLIESVQFDTIYHEHFSYFTLAPLRRAFSEHGLEVVDVDELPTHGGSLRIYVSHAGARPTQPSVEALLRAEDAAGLNDIRAYTEFQAKVEACKAALLQFLAETEREGLAIAAYGAPAKGNTLLNYCGVDASQIPFTVDRNPMKQGHLLPGSHIPVLAPEAILQRRPDRVLVLPWNLLDEVREQMCAVPSWGGRFVIAIPSITVV